MIPEKILKFFSRKNVLVTGGTGLIGRQVVDILVSADSNVKVVSIDKLHLNPKVKYVYGDLSFLNFCQEVSNGMDFVFHLAGVQGTVQTSAKMLSSHFVPTLMMNTAILEACRQNKVRRTVYTSSIGAYAEGTILRESQYKIDSIPMSFAGWAKRMAEQQIYSYKVQYGLENFSIVRPSNVFGPGDNFDPDTGMVIPALMARIHKKENPLQVWGNGSCIRDFVFSLDVAEGIILALYHGTKGEFINLGAGKGHSVKEVVETLSTFIKFDYMFDSSKPTGAPKRILDISKAKKLIGYDPQTTLRDGLEKTWNWFRENSREHKKKINYYKV